MADDKLQNNSGTTPVFESVPADPSYSTPQPVDLQPEEVPSEVVTPEDAFASTPSDLPPDDSSPIYEDNRMKYVFIVGGIVIFILIFFFIFKALLGGGGPKKDVKLTYWGLWEDKEIFDPLIADYQTKNPHVKIDYVKMAPKEYRERLLARSQNKQGPDIFRFHNTWLPEIKDVVAQLPSSIMSNDEFEKTFYPIHAKDLKIGKYYYGIPLEVDGLVLFYNDSLFKKAGISKAPASWEEVINDVGNLTVKGPDGKLITSGIALGTSSENIEHFSNIFGVILLQNGGDLKKLNEKSAAEALQFYRQFAEDSKISTWDSSMPNSVTAFAQEKVAMIIAPSWEALTVKAMNPEILLKIAPIPFGPGVTKNVSLADYWVEGVSKQSDNQLEAWKFLKFLSEKENMTKLYEIESKTRRFGEPYSRVDLASKIVQNEYIGVVIRQAQSDSYYSLPLVTRTYDNGLNDEIVKYIENAINSTEQGVSYSEALQTAKLGIDQVLAKYQLQ
ncbi:MAG: extracellular solute-binding protein [bacterium]|nr:extracellular solute-binding protein [bacterium]